MSVESAAEWMARAALDLDAAESRVGIDPELACYLSQQCIEKSLKVMLVFENIPLEYTHSLSNVHGVLPPGWSAINLTYDWERISEWAVTGRYPSDKRPTMEDAIYGTSAARRIYDVVSADMNKRLN